MKRNKLRRIITAIAVAILLPLALAVGAEEVYGFLSSSSSLSNLVFYNAKKEEKALFVEKQVESADENNLAPKDAEFEFTLQVNGEVQRDVEYEVYTSDGKYVYNYPDGETTTEDPTQLENERRTDRYGHFKLKAGQKAKFINLSPGDQYKVIEESVDPFKLVYPASADGSLTGTLTNDGDNVVFRNLYAVGTPGTLVVRKTVSYPQDYEIPETPEFTFQVKIGGETYADKTYTVKDIATGSKVKEAKTDEDGCLTLTGNTYAEFTKVPADKDYEVKEILTEAQQAIGWRTVGDNVQEGATTSSGTDLVFANVLASFSVTKRIEGGNTTDDEFEFQLTNASGTEPFGLANYYLYDSTHQLITDDPVATDSDGKFKLKAGQCAVFVGLEAGTTYGIKETNSGSFVQYLPASGSYTDKVVEDSVEEIPFINATTVDKTVMSVRKTIVNKTNNNKLPDDLFTFRISKKVTIQPEEDGAEPETKYEPLNKAPYDIQGPEGTLEYETDENGVFTLHAWETATFIDLTEGETYRVEEVEEEMPKGYKVTGDGYAEKTITADDLIKIEIENEYNGRLFPFVGGKGIALFVIIGLAMIAAGWYIVRKKSLKIG